MKHTGKDSDGAQTVDRAVSVLRHLGSGGQVGIRLVDLQTMTRLSKPTVHRILVSLSRHGMVEQDLSTRRYRLGREMGILGALAGWHSHDLRECAQSPMAELAEATEDTIFLAVPSGYEAVCIDRKLGSYPIKALTVDVGTRRPLGVGAMGIALLACLDAAEEEKVYVSIRGPLAQFPNVSERLIRNAVRHARTSGYAVSDGHILSAVRGIGMPLLAPGAVPVGALGVAAIRERIPNGRIEKLAALLARIRSRIERQLVSLERVGGTARVREQKVGAR